MNFFHKKIFADNRFAVCLVILISSLVMLPVLFKGLPYGYDMPHHFQCAFTFYESFINGDFYPSWSEFRNQGFGGMEVRLYPPVSHYTLAIFYFLCSDWHIATWLTLTFFTVVGSLGIYIWSKELIPLPQAVFAACLYAFLPYHLTQVYNTFFYAEFAGSAILPFCFAFVVRICKCGRSSDVVGLAIACCALILTHLPLTVIGSICLGIYAVSFFERKDFIAKSVKLALAVMAALASSSFFWVKVLQERDLLAKTSVYTERWFDYRLNFLLTPIQTFEGFHLEVYQNSVFFYDLMFLCAAGLSLMCTIPFFFSVEFRRKFTGVWFVFVTSVFMVTPFSRFVWDNIGFLQEVQFPWRWLSIVCITGSILSASYLDCVVEWFRGKNRPFALIIGGSIIAVLTFSISQIIVPAPFVERNQVANWVDSAEKAEGFTFWWTPWTRKEIFKDKNQVSAANREVQIQQWTATEKQFQIAAGNRGNISIAIFYHPNWTATVNGNPVKTFPADYGRLIVPVQEESATVNIFFQETISVQISRCVSICVWLLIFLFLSNKIRNLFIHKFIIDK